MKLSDIELRERLRVGQRAVCPHCKGELFVNADKEIMHVPPACSPHVACELLDLLKEVFEVGS